MWSHGGRYRTLFGCWALSAVAFVCQTSLPDYRGRPFRDPVRRCGDFERPRLDHFSEGVGPVGCPVHTFRSDYF